MWHHFTDVTPHQPVSCDPVSIWRRTRTWKFHVSKTWNCKDWDKSDCGWVSSIPTAPTENWGHSIFFGSFKATGLLKCDFNSLCIARDSCYSGWHFLPLKNWRPVRSTSCCQLGKAPASLQRTSSDWWIERMDKSYFGRIQWSVHLVSYTWFHSELSVIWI